MTAEQTSTTNDVQVNIEEIMQEIRQQILAKKDRLSQGTSPIVPVSGKRLSPDFYEHLYQAAMIHDQIGIKIHITEVNVPIIGSILKKLRIKLHELTLFYVNKLAAQQIQFNAHILQALSLIAQEMESENQEKEI